jgi:hypothetical protein
MLHPSLHKPPRTQIIKRIGYNPDLVALAAMELLCGSYMAACRKARLGWSSKRCLGEVNRAYRL